MTIPSHSIKTGYVPHRFQAMVHQAMRRFSVLVCHRRWGKTVLAVNALIDAALRCVLVDGHFGYVAPQYNQAKSIAWGYLKRFSLAVPGVKVNESELSVVYPNGAKVRLFGANNPDSLRGMYFDGVVLDEMADMDPELWGTVVRPALADRRGWALFIGTPKGINPFYELYHNATNNVAGYEDWYSALFTVEDTGIIDPDELKMARATMSDNSYRQEWLCDFAASCDNVLITVDLVTAAVKRVVSEADVRFAPRILGVDVARFGDDRSCIVRRQGLIAWPPKSFRNVDNMYFAQCVAREIEEFKPHAVFVDGGRGEGVIDRLRQLGHKVVEVHFGGGAAKGLLYANKRAEMWFEMKEWLEAGGMIPDDAELKASLAAPTYHFDAAGHHCLEKKEDMKKRVAFSPDPADALALTFAHPVHVDPPRKAAKYNPLDYR